VARRVEFRDGKLTDAGPLLVGRAKRIFKCADGEEIDLDPEVTNPVRTWTYTIENDPFKRACLHAKRSGDARAVIAMLRGHWRLNEWDQEMLADLLEQAKLKRPHGNARGKDPWVALAVDVAREHKQQLYRLGWTKGKGHSIDAIAIGTAVAYMQHCGYPMRPDEEMFKSRVRTELHRARKAQ
jgi:hypothetical protein